MARKDTQSRTRIDREANESAKTLTGSDTGSIAGLDPDGLRSSERHPQGHLPTDPKTFKESPDAQFEYGRASQHSTERYARGSKRLEHGNPDVGEIDLGNIEADKPAEPDDDDHFD